jgi:hypothetical protein
MNSHIVEAFDDDLTKLLCSECREPFEHNEVIVYIVELSKTAREVPLSDSVGAIQRVLKPAHDVRLVHGSRPCYARLRQRTHEDFMRVLVDPPRRSQHLNRSPTDRHSALLDAFQYYHRLVVQQDAKLCLMPTLQQTGHEAAPSYMMKAEVRPKQAFVIEDRVNWSLQQLSLFLQRFTEFRITVQIKTDMSSKQVATQFEELLRSPSAWTGLTLKHRCHMWADTLEMTAQQVVIRYVLWQGPSEAELAQLHAMLLSSKNTVTWNELVVDAAPCSEFHTMFLLLNADITQDTENIMKRVITRTFPASLSVYYPTLTRSSPRVVYLSTATATKGASDYDDDTFCVRHNTQPTPEASEYFTLHWTTSASSSSSQQTEWSPALIQVKGHAMDPGMPCVTHSREAVVNDLGEDVNLRFVGADDSRLTRLL